ncbi:MAG: type I-U CRISPR-associated protein Csb2 [Myxococcota bacterium]|nr:type I-U CRISPR-associated protein Csb2 [Myxococcota bacterium]MDW8361704.1 type I-U CRISPR-associated protein Csb2 [Myxococcales bacterium]
MATLVLRFPAGRYHATPHGHHANEGLVEWPPCPWRLVRALLAVGFATQRWKVVPEPGRRLVEQLAAVLPEYRLPPAAVGHSRHYMPAAKFEKGREATNLVYDAFAHTGAGKVWVRWPVSLDSEAARLFETLANHMGYLGRSESWVEAFTVPDDEPLPAGGAVFPNGSQERPGRGYEQIALLAPEEPRQYAEWRKNLASTVETEPKESNVRSGRRRSKSERAGRSALPPEDLLGCLLTDTETWRSAGWNQAPGSRLVLYWRPVNSLEVGPPTAPRRPRSARVEATLLALTTSSGSMSALPPIARTLPQAERLHRQLVARLGENAAQCPEVTGRGEDGAPLQGHRHAHILPLDLDADGHLDHVMVHAKMGLGELARRAIASVPRTWSKGRIGDISVALVAEGKLESLRRMPEPLGGAIRALLGPSRHWVSATPFVPPRHLKSRGRDTVEGQVLRELEVRGLPRADVELLPWTGRWLELRHFVRRRQPPAVQPPVDIGFVVRLTFAEPQAGPLSLGYACHFGLGRFVCEPDRASA